MAEIFNGGMNWLKQKWRLLVVWLRLTALAAAVKKGTVNMDMVLGVLRAVLAALGGWLINKGYVDAGQAESLTGAIIVIITGIWSILSKQKTAKAMKAAQ